MASVEIIDSSKRLREIGSAQRELEHKLPQAGKELLGRAADVLYRALHKHDLIDPTRFNSSSSLVDAATVAKDLKALRAALVEGEPSRAAAQLSGSLPPLMTPEVRRMARNLPPMAATCDNMALFKEYGEIGGILGGADWPNSMSSLAIAALNESLRTGEPLSGLRLRDRTITDSYIRHVLNKDGHVITGQCQISGEKMVEKTKSEIAEFLRPYFTNHEDGSVTIGPKLAKYIESRLAGTNYDLDVSPEREAERTAISNLCADHAAT